MNVRMTNVCICINSYDDAYAGRRQQRHLTAQPKYRRSSAFILAGNSPRSCYVKCEVKTAVLLDGCFDRQIDGSSG